MLGQGSREGYSPDLEENTDTHTNIALSCGNSLGTNKNVIRHLLLVEEFHTFSSGRYSQNFILN